MAEPSVSSSFIALNDQRWQLEQRYIQLLEQRIANLELLVKEASDAEKESAEGRKTASADDDKEERRKKKKSHIRRVIARYDIKSGIRKDVDDDKESVAKNDEGFSITFRQRTQSSAELNDGYCEVDIAPGKVRDLLKETIKEYPGLSWGGEIVNINTPFFPLVHNWKILEHAAEKRSTDDSDVEDTREALAELLAAIQSSPELSGYFKTRQSYLDARITTFDTIWSLFVPGQLLYARAFLKHPQLFTIDSAPFQAGSRERRKLKINCWIYDWNGKDFVKAYHKIPIDQFRGTKPVNELPCYPLEYFEGDDVYKTREELCQSLIRRGSQFNRNARAQQGRRQMFQYAGEALAEGRSTISIGNEYDYGWPSARPKGFFQEDLTKHLERESAAKRKLRTVQSKYIVDAGAFLRYGDGKMALGDSYPYDIRGTAGDIMEIANHARGKGVNISIDDYTKEEAEFLYLLPPRFLGYSTQDKFWGQFSVDATEPVEKTRQDPFDEQLQFHPDYKKMISALVKNHTNQDQSGDADQVVVTDLIPGKGKGLVILLHGPPGVGKTLTAETIAEATGKPLFVVSVAEIGLDASKAEKNLEQMFALAGAWEAVLLVDEADVFLESRNSEHDMERNALVSILLRVLEYYHGIMILTTNRINTIDVAVQSRIHLAVRYEDLKKDQKKKIFQFYLDQLEPSNIQRRSKIDDWIDEAGSELDLNGRQIRNIVSAALALARSTDDGRVSKEHLKKVAGISKDFAADLAMTTKNARDANEAGRRR